MSDKRAGETQEEAKLRRNQITLMPWWTREELKDERVRPWGKPKGLKREDFQLHDAKSSIKMMILSSI
jgi:hypothetical protein